MEIERIVVTVEMHVAGGLFESRNQIDLADKDAAENILDERVAIAARDGLMACKLEMKKKP